MSHKRTGEIRVLCMETLVRNLSLWSLMKRYFPSHLMLILCNTQQVAQFDPSVIPLKTVEEFEDTLELPFHYHMVASYPQVAGSAVGRGSSYKGSEMRQV